jgi:hypothetical protein
LCCFVSSFDVQGNLHGRELVYALSNVGMVIFIVTNNNLSKQPLLQVFASSVSTIMITQFAVDAIIFTGSLCFL